MAVVCFCYVSLSHYCVHVCCLSPCHILLTRILLISGTDHLGQKAGLKLRWARFDQKQSRSDPFIYFSTFSSGKWHSCQTWNSHSLCALRSLLLVSRSNVKITWLFLHNFLSFCNRYCFFVNEMWSFNEANTPHCESIWTRAYHSLRICTQYYTCDKITFGLREISSGNFTQYPITAIWLNNGDFHKTSFNSNATFRLLNNIAQLMSLKLVKSV